MIYRFAILVPVLLLSACKVDQDLGLTKESRLPIQNENPSNCPNWQSGDKITINEDTTLPQGCHYDRVSFELTSSNITFDCHQATLNGLGKTKRNSFFIAYKKDEAPLPAAFFILGEENNFIENITIKNCKIQYYVNGINVNFAINSATANDLKNNINVVAIEEHLRTLSPKNIQVENTEIIANHRTGIYLQRYITDFKLKNSLIKANDIGIYLESGTKNNLISNSIFTKNGDSTYDVHSRKRKIRIRKREAIAIDSSAYNTIVGNKFINNEGGAIFLYKNCYENHTDATSLPRIQHSSFNIIKENTFSDENKGIWIASRQSRPLGSFNCGDRLIGTSDNNKEFYYEDFADHNQIIDNVFDGVVKSIIVEDDDTLISNNHFMNESRTDITIGTEMRNKFLNQPVKRTTVENNRFESTATPPVRILFDSSENVFNNNQPPVSLTKSTEFQ